jgi:ATP-dependent DNA ligase
MQLAMHGNQNSPRKSHLLSSQLSALPRGFVLFNEHIAEDGPAVFAHACRLGAEGIVSKKIDNTYRSGPCRVWIKVRNPTSIAVQRERSELWNR